MRRQSSVTEGVVQKNTIVLYCLRRTTVAVHWGNESLLTVGMVANLNLVAPVIAAWAFFSKVIRKIKVIQYLEASFYSAVVNERH